MYTIFNLKIFLTLKFRFISLLVMSFFAAALSLAIIGCGPHDSERKKQVRPVDLDADVAFGVVPSCKFFCRQKDSERSYKESSTRKYIISMINSAKNEIILGTFNFSKKEIYDALLAAQKRGVKVRAFFPRFKLFLDVAEPNLFSEENDLQLVPRINQCIRGNIERIRRSFPAAKTRQEEISKICDTKLLNLLARLKLFLPEINNSIITDVPKLLYHRKFIIVDRQRVMFGSGNFTGNGVGYNFEEWTYLGTNSDLKSKIISGLICEADRLEMKVEKDCSNDRIFFTPTPKTLSQEKQRDMVKEIVSAIDSAQKSLDIFVHKIHAPSIIKALENAAKRGVVVRLIRSLDEIAKDKSWLGQEKPSPKNPFRFVVRGGNGQQAHAKYAIVDDEKLLIGTGNWTIEGLSLNYEFFIDFRDAHFKLESLKNFFNEVWNLDYKARESE